MLVRIHRESGKLDRLCEMSTEPRNLLKNPLVGVIAP
jgi:hypothetical protein